MRHAVALVLSLVVVLGLSANPARALEQEAKVEHVKLTVADGHYVVTPGEVTKGVPVKMVVDLETVKGCARTVVIAAFGVKKKVTQDDSTIEFTPDKSGTIEIACGMDMVQGSFTVVER